jgi:hypothetical protein
LLRLLYGHLELVGLVPTEDGRVFEQRRDRIRHTARKIAEVRRRGENFCAAS